MTPEWKSPAESDPILARSGAVRTAVVFGAGAIALALAVVPFVDNRSGPQFAQGEGLDRMQTGSVPPGGSYTIRRSVLQSSPNAVCIIRPNGSRSGDC